MGIFKNSRIFFRLRRALKKSAIFLHPKPYKKNRVQKKKSAKIRLGYQEIRIPETIEGDIRSL